MSYSVLTFVIFFVLPATPVGEQARATPAQLEKKVLSYVKRREGSNVICLANNIGHSSTEGECWDLATCAVMSAGIGPTWNCYRSKAYGGLAPIGWTAETDAALRLAHRQTYSGEDYNVTAFGLGVPTDLRAAIPVKPFITSHTSKVKQGWIKDDYRLHPNCYVFGTPIKPTGTTRMWQDVWTDGSTSFTGMGVKPGDILQMDQFTARCHSPHASPNLYYTGHMHTAVIYKVMKNDLVVCEQNYMGVMTTHCTHRIFEVLSKCPGIGKKGGKWQFSYYALTIYRPAANGARGPACNKCTGVHSEASTLLMNETNQRRFMSSRLTLLVSSTGGLSVMLALFLLLHRHSAMSTNSAMVSLLQ